MQEHIPPEFGEAPRPFELPADFDGVRLLYHAEAAHVEHARATCDKEHHPLCERAPLTDIRLRWKLEAADGEVLREGERVVKGVLADEESRQSVGGFLAWYIAVREIADQNDARFHPPSEIPVTLLGDGGEQRPTPPHFFTS